MNNAHPEAQDKGTVFCPRSQNRDRILTKMDFNESTFCLCAVPVARAPDKCIE